jgi:hypothetical protein
MIAEAQAAQDLAASLNKVSRHDFDLLMSELEVMRRWAEDARIAYTQHMRDHQCRNT